MVYNINMKRARGPLSPGVVFTLVGLLFLIIIGSIVITTFNKKNSFDGEIEAYDVVWDSHRDSDGNILYSPIYHYSVDGNNYTCTSSSSSSSKSGDGIVYYDTKDPSRCMTDFEGKTSFSFALFLFLPIIFIVVGVLQLKKTITKGKIAKELAKTGVLVKGIPFDIVDSNLRVNNRVLPCLSINYKFPDGNVRNLVGEPISGNIVGNNSGCCDLLYDPNNYDNYFIDFEITTTGMGVPNVVYYEQTQPNTNNQTNYDDPYGNYHNQTN